MSSLISPLNAQSVYAALADFGAPLQDITANDFEKPYSVVRLGVPPVCIDILQHIDGIGFETVWAASAIHQLDGGLPAHYISADHLIVNKLASGRPQDLADVAALRQAQAAVNKRNL